MKLIMVIAACFVCLIYGCKDKNAEKKDELTSQATNSTTVAAPANITPDVSFVAQEIKAALQKQAVKSQLFSSDSLGGFIVGKHGTLIRIDKSALETIDGKPITGDVVVELKELTDKGDFMAAEAPTVSNGKLLISGGSYFIGMQSNGQQVKLRTGKKLNVQLPKAGNGMSLFYGQRDNNGAINWQPANQPLANTPATGTTIGYKSPDGHNYWLNGNEKVTRWLTQLERAKKDLKHSTMIYTSTGPEDESHRTMKASDFRQARGVGETGDVGSDTIETKKRIAALEDSLSKEGKTMLLAATLYDQIAVANLGWINCDRFYSAPEVMDLAYNVLGRDSIKYAKVFVLFNDINSLMEGAYSANADNNMVRRVPVGSNVTLIAMSIRDKKVLVSKVRTTTARGATVALELKEATENEMRNLFK